MSVVYNIALFNNCFTGRWYIPQNEECRAKEMALWVRACCENKRIWVQISSTYLKSGMATSTSMLKGKTSGSQEFAGQPSKNAKVQVQWKTPCRMIEGSTWSPPLVSTCALMGVCTCTHASDDFMHAQGTHFSLTGMQQNIFLTAIKYLGTHFYHIIK